MSEPDYRDLYYKMIGLYDAAKIIHEAELAEKDKEIARLREFLKTLWLFISDKVVLAKISGALEARDD